MKAAPIFHELRKQDLFEVELVHTGQHYDKKLSDDILNDLEIPAPKTNLNVGSGSHAVQTANIMIRYEAHCEAHRPDLVVVVGDVNSTIACTLTAKKLGLQVAHLESGLRSWDMGMPEEINRLLTDRISDVLWTPSLDGNENLIKEGVHPSKISFVGNLMIDSLVKMQPKFDKIDVCERYALESKNYGLITLHRPSNVDEPQRFIQVFSQIAEVGKLMGVRMVFPVHPRTRKMVELPAIQKMLENGDFIILEPLAYLEFMAMVKSAKFLITDSGGIQEETTFMGVPCFTLRPNTERPITITEGSNRLVEPETLVKIVVETMSGPILRRDPPQNWDGKAAARVVADIKKRYLEGEYE